MAQRGTEVRGLVKRGRIGEHLVRRGLLSPDQLDVALEYQRKTGEPLGEALVRLGFLDKELFLKVLAEHLGVEFRNLGERPPDPAVRDLLPPALSRRLQVLPLERRDGAVVLAMKDPSDVEAQEEVRLVTGLEVEPVLADDLELKRILEEQTGPRPAPPAKGAAGGTVPDGAAEGAADAPVISLVNALLLLGVREKASDMHIEPLPEKTRVRLRVDGLLRDGPSPPRHLHEAMVARIKVMAGLDIAERRLPQDGRFSFQCGERSYDVRVSTMPSLHGEKAVLRVLDKSAGIPPLEALGMSPEVLTGYRRLLHQPYGLILVTGPTGSGKSTTLAASLRELDGRTRNIVTVEDPIEYEVPDATQTQINVKAGLTFAVALRHLLRQDPDVIMVGEVRDLETAAMAVRAALTGHLVLSTLHTNDAPGAVARLLDMGVEPYLLAPALTGVLSQRLVRLLCPRCRRRERPPARVLPQGMEVGPDERFCTAVGCRSCRHGYRGRTGIFELLTVTDRLRDLILERAPGNVLQREALAGGELIPLVREGLARARSGDTSLEEVVRAVLTEAVEAPAPA